MNNIIRLSLLTLPLLVFYTAAAADNGEAVAIQMLKCLQLPENVPDKFEMSAQVVLKHGSAEFVSINFHAPPTDWEKTAAPAIADAITGCEPYDDISGTVSVSVTPALLKLLHKK